MTDSNWIPDDLWKTIQQIVPIACVDVLLLKADSDVVGATQIGLIKRKAPSGPGWCLVGGRVMRNETIGEAISRHLDVTLGKAISYTLESNPQPLHVEQYFTYPREVGRVDPRQHSIALTFAVRIGGAPVPQPRSEATEFGWFDLSKLPVVELFGFDQHRVVAACLTSLKMTEFSFCWSPT